MTTAERGQFQVMGLSPASSPLESSFRGVIVARGAVAVTAGVGSGALSAIHRRLAPGAGARVIPARVVATHADIVANRLLRALGGLGDGEHAATDEEDADDDDGEEPVHGNGSPSGGLGPLGSGWLDGMTKPAPRLEVRKSRPDFGWQCYTGTGWRGRFVTFGVRSPALRPQNSICCSSGPTSPAKLVPMGNGYRDG